MKQKTNKYYRVTVDKMFPFVWTYTVHAVDGASLLGMWGTSFTKKRAYAKADRAVARHRRRVANLAKPRTVRG